MACCLTSPNHYLKQYWLIISEDLWHSSEGNLTGNAPDIYPWNEFENYQFRITTAPLRGHWAHQELIVTKIWVGKITSIGANNGLSPGWRQAIIWTNAGILLIGHLETHLSEVLSEIQISSFQKMHLKMLSGKWQPFCLSLNVLKEHITISCSR